MAYINKVNDRLRKNGTRTEEIPETLGNRPIPMPSKVIGKTFKKSTEIKTTTEVSESK